MIFPTSKFDAGPILNDAPYLVTFEHARLSHVLCRSAKTQKSAVSASFAVTYDRFAHGIQEIADMPAEKIELLHRFLRQEGGRLSKRARENEFAALTDREAEQIEALYRASSEDKQPTAKA